MDWYLIKQKVHVSMAWHLVKHMETLHLHYLLHTYSMVQDII